MKSPESPKLRKRIRRLLLTSAVLVFSVSTGMFTTHIEDQAAMVHLSKLTMAAAVQSAVEKNQDAPLPGIHSQLPTGILLHPDFPYSSPSSSFASSGSDSGSSEIPADAEVYQAMYPGLYAGPKEPAPEKKDKTVYLTFDDGPSSLTVPLLDVLDRYHVKATFFVVGRTDQQSLEAMEEIVGRGHAIGVHSYTHQYQQIYATPAAFLIDFAEMHDLILKDTGFDTKIYRYAGGSINDYNHGTAKAIIAEMNRRGYVYYDWNVSSGDAEHGSTAHSVYINTINGVHEHHDSVVLFHNTKNKGNTLAELPKIIETLQKEGYSFEKLDPSVDNTPYKFRIPPQ